LAKIVETILLGAILRRALRAGWRRPKSFQTILSRDPTHFAAVQGTALARYASGVR